MKKTIIAGAAASVLAAMPVVGVFAVTDPADLVDNLSVTIEDTCTWSRTLKGTEGSTTISGGNTITATMTAGQKIETFGTSTLNVKCNNPTGYKIKATMTGLTGKKADQSSNGDSIDYATTLAEGKWTAIYNENGIASGTEFIITDSSSNTKDGTEYVITYGVYTSGDQAAGTYTGDVTYELTQNS